MDLKIIINDVTQLQHHLNQNTDLKYHISLETDGVLWDLIIPLTPLSGDDLDFYYRAVFKLIDTPPPPLASAGYGFIDKNLANYDRAKGFGNFGVNLWLKPFSTATPKIFTCNLVLLDVVG